jgi:FAD/FMN-containing dehydrogenase/Fe-S oxidoreductase
MDARHRIPQLSPEARAAADLLRREVAGEVSTTPLRRWLYSTDASGYRVVPEVVVVAGSTADIGVVAEIAARAGLPITARGAASSVAGQAIGPGVALDCFKLDRVLEIDAGRRVARVQPGVVQAALNVAAAPHGLEFGPDTSTVDQATIGGMVGNNSSGSRSIVYGESKDKVLRVAGVLAGGAQVAFGAAGADPAGGQAGRRLAAALAQVRERYGEPIATGFPHTRRCTSGYNLRELLVPQPNLARLLAGSEGTLALFTELEVLLDPRPARRVGAALSFATLRAALEANVAILETGPSAVEFLDLAPLRRAPNLMQYRRLATILDGADAALLTVEYQGDDDEALAGLGRLRRLAGELGAGQVVWLEDAGALADAAALRRAVLPLLMGAPGAERPAAFVEDTAVAPERLAEFVADLQRLLAAHGARASFTGHASAGCLHLRPMLDLKTAAGVASMEALAGEVGALVIDYHGAISGEHGCGRSRSWFLPRLLGPQLYAAMVAVKDAFDPQRLLNPGVVVNGPDVAEHLRFGADYRGDGGWAPRLSYAPEGGFGAAVERCFGSGLCKKQTGTMCPPAAATRDEARSTRARANALQGVVSGAIPLAAIAADEFREVLGTCVACKACKTECQAGVDMAALKVEWLAEVRAREGVPPLARGIGDFRRLASLAAPAAPVVNALARTRAARFVTDRVGIAPARPLPAFVRRPLTRRLGAAAAAAAAAATAPAGQAAAAAATRRAVLFVDCFIQYQEPGIGEALARLLAAAGLTLELADVGCCGRTALSTGQADKARATARRALAGLRPFAAAGADLLFIEPSCLSMVRDDWTRLLPGDPDVALVAGASRPALDLVADLGEEGRLHFRAGGRALLHSHCHEKALGFAAATRAALAAVPGLEVDDPDAGCCGMSGVFGYEAEHYDLSVAIAEDRLLPAVRAAGPDTAVLATGTSCRTQVRDLAGRSALHPLEFLAGRLLP